MTHGHPVLAAAQMQAADRRAIEELGIPVGKLMERAGEGLVHAAAERLDLHKGDRVVIVCGKGNNGGDGMVAARHFRALGLRATVLLLGRGRDLTGAATGVWAVAASVWTTARIPSIWPLIGSAAIRLP